MELEDLNNKIDALETNINNLKDSIKLKDDQIETMKDSIKLKEDQINTLKSSLNIKEEKILTLEKTLKLKEDQIQLASDSSIDESVLAEKDKQIEELQKEIDILNGELAKSDEDLEQLELENEKLRSAISDSSNSKIIDSTKTKISKPEIIEKMREILKNALSKVMISVPNINDLQDLYLYEMRASVNIKISCKIDPEIAEEVDLLEEFESLDNISLRNFEGGDRYIIVRDGEELMLAVVGGNEDNHLVFHTKDPNHITLFNSIIMEGWLRGRKI